MEKTSGLKQHSAFIYFSRINEKKKNKKTHHNQDTLMWCPFLYLELNILLNSSNSPGSLCIHEFQGTFQIWMLICQNNVCKDLSCVTVDVQSYCSSSTPAESHHNPGRCSQIPSSTSSRSTLTCWFYLKVVFLDSDVFEFASKNPADAVMISAVDWIMNICLWSLQSLHVCWSFVL